VKMSLLSPSLTANGVPITGKNAAQLNSTLLDRKRHCRHRRGLGGRVHPQIAWAKLRDGAAIASKKLWS